jgi:hypothetical protein
MVDDAVVDQLQQILLVPDQVTQQFLRSPRLRVRPPLNLRQRNGSGDLEENGMFVGVTLDKEFTIRH